MKLYLARKFVGLFTVASCSVLSVSAAFARDTDNAENKSASPGASESGSFARGLFFEQMKKPETKLNTGVIYWVELDRGGQKSHVTNKTEFMEGDKIRFHFKPNIDGYAYILMAEGSKGEKVPLFPSGELTDNKVKCGEEITLPFAKGSDQAWLRFDDNPGTEIVRIVVSRTPIDLKRELSDTRGTESALQLSAKKNSDKIPTGTYVSMEDPATTSSVAGSRGLSLEVRHAPEQAGEIAVVNADPQKELSIDISLEHKKKVN
jgi:hypothetical protein